MYDVLFLSFLIPEEIDAQVRGKMSKTMDDAASAWQKNVISGIESNIGGPVTLFNYLPIKSYPKYYKDAFVKKSVFSHTAGAKDINLPFCNVKYIKRLFLGNSVKREVRQWAKNNDGREKIIVAYTLYPEYLKAINEAKRINPLIKSAAIVLDLPEYMVLTKQVGLYTKLFLKWNRWMADRYIDRIDYFSLITDQMKEKLDIHVPYCVIEGICTSQMPPRTPQTDGLKRVFYGGTLHEKFGVLQLANAFRQIEDPRYRLVICGYGDAEDKIREAAKQDARIDFKGQLKREEVLSLMVGSDVIVNPRQGKEDFAKYSFPSKNLEALSSGVPFIGYKLAGIPDEYDEFINYPENDSERSLAQLIFHVCEDADEEYSARAQKAKNWVKENKGPDGQAKKLMDLLQRVK